MICENVGCKCKFCSYNLRTLSVFNFLPCTFVNFPSKLSTEYCRSLDDLSNFRVWFRLGISPLLGQNVQNGSPAHFAHCQLTVGNLWCSQIFSYFYNLCLRKHYHTIFSTCNTFLMCPNHTFSCDMHVRDMHVFICDFLTFFCVTFLFSYFSSRLWEIGLV